MRVQTKCCRSGSISICFWCPRQMIMTVLKASKTISGQDKCAQTFNQTSVVNILLSRPLRILESREMFAEFGICHRMLMIESACGYRRSTIRTQPPLQGRVLKNIKEHLQGLPHQDNRQRPFFILAHSGSI